MANILSPMMPKEAEPEHIEFHETAQRGSKIMSESRSIRGLAHRKKTIKAVCQRCNHGWMSIIEAATKPKLIPLIRGQATLLDWYARQMITDWIILKLFVVEFNGSPNSPPDPIFSNTDREYFRVWRVIPPHIRIWLAKHSSPLKWKSGIFRHTAGLAPFGVTLPEPARRAKNTQSVTLGIGSLLIHITATTLDGNYPMIDTLGSGPMFRLLWPIGDADIRWPPLATISEFDANWIADDIERLVRDPGTLHID